MFGTVFLASKMMMNLKVNATLAVQVLQVKAIDGDRNINNEIEYEITSGPEHVFGVNKNTGTIYSKAIIDRESSYATYGTFILGKSQ